MRTGGFGVEVGVVEVRAEEEGIVISCRERCAGLLDWGGEVYVSSGGVGGYGGYGREV